MGNLPDRLTRNQIVQAALALVGTPYRHQGRVPGPNGGTDCIGTLVLTARALDYPHRDQAAYSRSRPGGKRLRQALEEHFRPVKAWWRRGFKPGDVVLFHTGRRSKKECHVAILEYREDVGAWGMIHLETDRPVSAVVRVILSANWANRIDSVWEFEGIED